MFRVHIEEKPAFRVSGAKTWISGQHNEEFAAFWAQCNTDGTCERLRSASRDPQCNVTRSRIMGISRVEKNPENRAFDFYIASETDEDTGYTSFSVEEGLWAFFDGEGTDPMALIRAEMEAFLHWLPESIYTTRFAAGNRSLSGRNGHLCAILAAHTKKGGVRYASWRAGSRRHQNGLLDRQRKRGDF